MSLSDFPNNSQFSLFFREFATFGYKCSADAIVTKFPFSDGSRRFEDFSVGISDGQTKILLMYAVVTFVAELELSADEMKEMSDVLASFKYVRCTYEHFTNPGHHFLHSLSFLDYISDFFLFG